MGTECTEKHTAVREIATQDEWRKGRRVRGHKREEERGCEGGQESKRGTHGRLVKHG